MCDEYITCKLFPTEDVIFFKYRFKMEYFPV